MRLAFIFCLYVCISTHYYACSVKEARNKCWISWEWSCRRIWMIIYIYGWSENQTHAQAVVPLPLRTLWFRKAFYNFTSQQTTAKPCLQERGNALLTRPHFILNLPSAPETLGTPCIFLFPGKRNAKLYYSHDDSLVSPGAPTQGLWLCIKSLLPTTFLWTQPVWELAVQSCPHCLHLARPLPASQFSQKWVFAFVFSKCFLQPMHVEKPVPGGRSLLPPHVRQYQQACTASTFNLKTFCNLSC